MSEEWATLSGDVRQLSTELQQALKGIHKCTDITGQLKEAMVRNEVHMQQIAEINQGVQVALKELDGRLRIVEMTQGDAVKNREDIVSIKSEIKSMKEVQQKLEVAVSINSTKIAPVWGGITKAVGAIITAAAMMAIGYYMGGDK